MKKLRKTVKHKKIVDDAIKFSDKQGNGILKITVSVDEKGLITRYSLTYINPHIFAGDNGRVLGYDNCHGRHHRHFMGTEEDIVFIGYEEIAEKFEKEWRALHEKIKSQKRPKKDLHR